MDRVTFLKNLFIFQTTIFLILAVFSYAYVDLNLTLVNNKTITFLISNLQNIAYYNRPVSTLIYLALDILLFSSFLLILLQTTKAKFNIKQILPYFILITFIMCLAYPFLSTDIFNYMFDAKIILKYHLSPYVHKALDFPSDDWIRFMRWTHRYSPYGPGWILISLIPSLLGFGKFILTLLAFKVFAGIFHILNTVIIYCILTKIKSNRVLLGVVFYALNPLFLIEGVLSGHNDVVLATTLLLSVYFVTYKKTTLSAILMLLGFLIKYLPILALPSFVLLTLKKLTIEKYILLNFIVLFVFTIIISTLPLSVPFISKGSTQVQFQPWYLFWTIPYISLLGNKKLMIISGLLCFGASLRYLPYLYFGDWSHIGTVTYMQVITISLPSIASLYILFKKYLILKKND